MNHILNFKNNLIDLELVEVLKNIYAVKITDKYDRAMLFCRFQEYYESPFEQFRNNDFDIFEYMRCYQLNKKRGVFTYTKDWSGYNLPSHSLEACLDGISNKNSYDKIMSIIYRTIREHTHDAFYLLGVDELDGTIMEHEIAHGLFYVNPEYKSDMMKMWRETPASIRDCMESILLEMGYCKDVVIDETQAYFSTGLTDDMEDLKEKYPIISKLENKFQEVFKNYLLII